MQDFGVHEREDRKDLSTSAFTLFWFFFPNYLFVFLSQILFSGTTFLNIVRNTFHAQALFKNQS